MKRVLSGWEKSLGDGSLFLPSLLWTGATMIVIMLSDRWARDVTVAPVVGICFLFVVALRYPPKTVALCLLLLLLFVGHRLWGVHMGGSQINHDFARFWVRIVTFGIAGLIAVAACVYRSRLAVLMGQILQVFSAIPLPLLVVNHRGFIQSCSDVTVNVSGLAKSNIIGHLLTDVVGAHLLEEVDENWFRHWLEVPEGKVFDVELQIGRHRSMAKVGRVGSGNHSIMIVIFV